MDAFGVLFLIAVGGYIIIKVVRKNNRQEYYDKLKSCEESYPLAFRQKFGYTSYFKEMDYSRLKEMANVSVTELANEEKRLILQRDRERVAREAQKKREEEARHAELEKQKKIKEALARKEKEVNEKYNIFKKRYPNGVAAFEQFYYGENMKEDVINNEPVIAKYEQDYKVCSFFEEWQRKHKEFSKFSRDARDKYLENWGCYKYDVGVLGKDATGKDKEYSFTIWQHFCEDFCRDESLDYSTRKGVKINYQRLSEFFGLKRHFTTHIYEALTKFIEKFENIPIVVFCDSGQNESAPELNNYHFSDFKEGLNYLDIDCFDFNEKERISERKPSEIIVIELVTSNESLKQNCSDLFDLCKDSNPCITYVSLLKEYSSEEMISIIKSDEKRLQQLKEKEKKEQEAKAEAERQRIEAEKKQKEILELQKQSSKRLKSCVTSWSTIPRSDIPYSFLLNYYPTTCDFEATSDEWDDRYLVWNFKNTPGKTSELQHDSALDEIIPRLSQKLQETFGGDLKYLTLVCIPASSQKKTQLRYEEFSERICQETGMSNAYSHITINGERGAKHAGEDTTGNITYTLEKDYFSGRNILLFDDVVTKGDSMRSWKQKMELCGSTVIAAMSIGFTTHERPIKQYEEFDYDLPF